MPGLDGGGRSRRCGAGLASHLASDQQRGEAGSLRSTREEGLRAGEGPGPACRSSSLHVRLQGRKGRHMASAENTRL